MIKLGLASALRDYSVEAQGEGIAWQRGPANPYAASVNVSSEFDKVDIWNEYIQEDWQTGVGRTDPTGGGFLYGELETRVPNQLILPPMVRIADTRIVTGGKADCRYTPEHTVGSDIVGAGGKAKVAMAFVTPASTGTSTVSFHFYARIPFGTSVKISVFSDSAGSPNAQVGTFTITGDMDTKSFYWVGGFVPVWSFSTQFWLVIEPLNASDSLEVARGTSGFDTVAKSWNGTSWVDVAGTYYLYNVWAHNTGASISAKFVRFNSETYLVTLSNIYKYVPANNNWTLVTAIGGTSANRSMSIVFGPYLYISRDAGNYRRMDTAGTLTTSGLTASLFVEYKGLLYRAYQNDLYYSADGTTWTGPFTVGGDDAEIRGMAGMGDSLYCATDKALMRFAPGNIVDEATRFGSEDANNGVGMTEYMGRLYIPASGRIFRFDPSGQLQDIWVSRDDDLPKSRIGTVSCLTRMNNWLVAFVTSPALESGAGTLWAFQEEGWHHLASVPEGGTFDQDYYHALYDRENSRLWFSGVHGGPYYIEILDYTLNAYTADDSSYAPYGWIEQDRYYGGQYLLNKNWESVTLVGELSGSQSASVYWKEEGDTTWNLLGTSTNDGFELRWDTPATRPTGRWIKLGVLLKSNLGYSTPRIRAIVVKFLPMVNDRIRDTLTLTLSDYIQLPDNTLSTYTAAQMLEHITGTSVIRADGIVEYTDPMGEEYEVTIIDYNVAITKYAYYNNASHHEYRCVVVVEQIAEQPFPA